MNTEAKEPEEDTKPEQQPLSISERTPVRLGLIVTAAGLLLSAVAWNAANAARVNAKLDNLTTLVSKAVMSSETLERRVSDHIADDQKRWTELTGEISALKQGGSEGLKELQKATAQLRIDFEIHRATNTK